MEGSTVNAVGSWRKFYLCPTGTGENEIGETWAWGIWPTLV